MAGTLTVKQWLRKNRFSICSSFIAFVMSTIVTQGIEWYKDNGDKDATLSGVRNETQRNLAVLQKFKQDNPAFNGECRKFVIDKKTSMNLIYLPGKLYGDFYMTNSQKISALDSDILASITAAYTDQQQIINNMSMLYTPGMREKGNAEQELYTLFCDYQSHLEALAKDLSE